MYVVNFVSCMQVLFGITNPELYILDTFEDVEYERRAVEVSLLVSATEILMIAPSAPFTHWKTHFPFSLDNH